MAAPVAVMLPSRAWTASIARIAPCESPASSVDQATVADSRGFRIRDGERCHHRRPGAERGLDGARPGDAVPHERGVRVADDGADG